MAFALPRSRKSRFALVTLLSPSILIASTLQVSTVARADDGFQNQSSRSFGIATEGSNERDRNFQVPSDTRNENSHAYPTVQEAQNRQPLNGSFSAGTVTKAAVTSVRTLLYNGAASNGVVVGSPKVYLIFYGSEWGTASTATDGATTLSGDLAGMAPYVYRFLAGLGTTGDTWSNVLTQYCDSSRGGTFAVGTGSSACPPGAARTGLPASSGALAGVWVDPSIAAITTFKSPGAGDQTILAQEAQRAAAHFGNTTPASNLSTQYVIVTPSGSHPDGFNTPKGGFCAWHSAVSSPSTSGTVAFTNLPYIPDMGASCGSKYVTSNPLDGVSIVEGHEYAETVSDMVPGTGWYNSTTYVASNGGIYPYGENGDICAWDSASKGTITLGGNIFAMQSTWSNATDSCAISASAPATAIKFTNSSAPSTTASTGIAYPNFQFTSDTAGATFTATGLPAGLTLSTTGILSGTSTASGSFTVVVTASNNDVNFNGVYAFQLTVTAPVLSAQPTLTVVPSKTTGPAGTAITLSISGGAGTGAVSFATATTGCTVSTADSISGTGSVIRSASTGSCSVTVSKAASGTYSAATSVATSITFTGVSQSALVLTPTSTSGPAGTAISLTASGGNGTAAYSLSATGTPTGCSVTQPNATTGIGTVNRSASTGSCTVTLNRAASGIYLAATAVTATIAFNPVNQATLTISTSNTAQIAKGTTGITLATTGGTGTGAVTYVASTTSPGTIAGSCVISGSKLTVATTATSSSPGGIVTCSIVANKAASTIYALASSAPVIFSFK
jgi:serine protease